MPSVRTFIAVALLSLGPFGGSVGRAGTIVLANRTTDSIICNLGGRDYELASGQVLPVRTDCSMTARFARSVKASYWLDRNAIYFFAPEPPSRVDLVRIGLGGDSASSSIFDSDREIQPADLAGATSEQPSPITIPVKLLYDDDEPASNEAAQRRLVQRLKAASEIFERHCFVRFVPVEVTHWESDDETTDFELSLADFERKVSAAPARLAIGFTSQYRLALGRTHLGGTRGPMHSHLLVREWSQHISEPERLEVLVHELGHFLGAVHSPEPDSVMRAVLGDKLARATSFRIGFDPLNTLAMCLVSEQLQTGRVTRFGQMSFPAQLELHKLYGEVARTDPTDKTPAQYVGILGQSLDPVMRGTKLVLLELDLAAGRNARRPPAKRLSGDALTDYFLRSAADVARRLPAGVGPRALLLALGIGLDRTTALAQHRLIGPLLPEIETAAARTSRIAAMGVPTAHGRHELARHFALAAALSAVVGHQEAERACLALQFGHKAQVGGFSPATYQADLAGIVFAYRVLSGRLPLDEVSARGSVHQFLPRQGEVEPLSAQEFEDQFGGPNTAEFRRLRNQLAGPLRASVSDTGKDHEPGARSAITPGMSKP